MNLIKIKTIFFLVIMMAFLIMALTTKNVVNSQLFAALEIVIGAIASSGLSTQNQIK